ncbi:chemoreceptor-like protein with four helix bundle sensory module [Pontibacter ummariensis]|uniref:Four helix bundle sensory module for signal transduction n=1 Tax=Pontibacter ummariensis TaxID=1610492 RepID=A0A239BUF1_9BACT|nr:MCP four helix bundle domain-containing protein [Pontibacter ummariensis]PRY15613.1 chemoreceptor-like protein with four helix bundle sensory module [Pontibacter ummariensis]SNS11546.1 Four helix bundle sensory module for signal transduction [Pontibacter ummariensis]
MSWNFAIGQRNKVALALGVVFLIIVLANWFVSYSMQQIGTQFQSVYEDRLVPALDISAMLERYYQNRMFLEEHLLSGSEEQTKLEERIANNHQEVDSLLAKFETTYLTNQESIDLREFKKASSNLEEVQLEIISLSKNGDKAAATGLFKTKGLKAFQDLLDPLHDLSLLQEQVGHELYASAERRLNSLKVLSYLVIGLAIVLALLVGTLLQTSRKLKGTETQRFHLN